MAGRFGAFTFYQPNSSPAPDLSDGDLEKLTHGLHCPVGCYQERLPMLLTMPNCGGRSSKRLRISFPSGINKLTYLRILNTNTAKKLAKTGVS